MKSGTDPHRIRTRLGPELEAGDDHVVTAECDTDE